MLARLRWSSLAAALCLPALAHAQPLPPLGVARDEREQRQDRRELREDRREIRDDARDARQLGGIIAFALVTETVFQWPGMGLLFIQAINFSDVPVMAAYLCLIALVFVLLNLFVDLIYYAVDPRLRVERGAAH